MMGGEPRGRGVLTRILGGGVPLDLNKPGPDPVLN